MSRVVTFFPLLLLLLLFVISGSLALNNGLGLTPQMGWNSWNRYGCDITEAIFRNVTDAVVALGLKDAGYEYVNLDDCVCTGRNADGSLIVDPVKFPSGLKALGDYVHSKGLKFGMYTDAGYKTCQGRPGLLGYDKIDFQSFASWGVDYVKVDWCNTPGGMKPEDRYPQVRDALLGAGRPIFFSMCEWGVDKPWEWAAPVANSWRTTGDINPSWNRIVEIVDAMKGLSKFASKGAWNDPDMLEIGNGSLTFDEQAAHFSLWSLMNAPLLMGNDITNMSNDTLTVLLNQEVIAVNQDPLGVPGDIRKEENVGVCVGCKQMWSKPLTGSAHAVVLFNKSGSTVNMTFDFSLLTTPHGSKYNVRCLWCHKDFGVYTDSMTFSVNSHGVKMLKLTPAAAAA